MSWSGMWLVGAVPDHEAAELPGRFLQLWQPGDGTLPAGFSAEISWWTGLPPGHDLLAATDPSAPGLPTTSGLPTAPGFPSAPRRRHGTPDAERFAELVLSARPSSPAVDAMHDACLALLQQAEHPDARFVALTRKADPATALHYALGPQCFGRLPGLFGDFLLTAAEVRAALPAVEETLALTGDRRAEALDRISAWLTVTGDAPEFVPATLLDGPLTVLRHAAATGSGATGFSQIF